MTAIPVPEFTQLHVVSDLHMGGETDFQVFTQAEALTALIGQLQDEQTTERVALLINGDMVDFLAEQPPKCFDPHGAVGKLDRIARDPTFAPVWDALRAFVATPNRHLIINLGNHDLELALPWVRAHLVELLTPEDAGDEARDEARGRITLVTEGTGFACTVGGKRALCLHGNEVDTWNVADHDMIRCIGRDLVQGRMVSDWTPNAGTKLVIEVMNDLKRRYAFVDLLKPEVQAVVPVLLALDETLGPRLQRLVATAARLSWDKIRRATGFLRHGEQPAPTPLEAETATPWTQRERAAPPVTGNGWPPGRAEAAAVVATAEENFRVGTDPLSLVDAAVADQLGYFGAAVEWARGRRKEEVLYAAVRDLAKDRSFDVNVPDETFRRIDKFVGPNIDFVVAGHTHMERQLRREHGPGTYFNTGSWIPRIRFTREMLSSVAAFEPIIRALREARTVAKLAAHTAPELLIYRPTVLSVVATNNETTASLRQAQMNGGALELQPIVGEA